MLHFMAGRVASGVESVTDQSYARTVRLGETRGWVKVEQSDRPHSLRVQVSTSLARVLPALLARLRCLFDLDARPDLIAEQLSVDPVLARAISALPGLRVPGCVDGFEMAVRAILGQRISVPAATTLAGRLAAAFGEPIETPLASLKRLSPTPERLARAEPEELDLAGHRRAAGTGDPRAGPGRGRSADRARAGRRSRPHDRAAQAASGHRRLDCALHCHARPALARRLPGGRPRLAASQWCTFARRTGEAGRAMAALAVLRGDHSLEQPYPPSPFGALDPWTRPCITVTFPARSVS